MVTLDKWTETYYRNIKDNMNIPKKYNYSKCNFDNTPVESYHNNDFKNVNKIKNYCENIDENIKKNKWVYTYGKVGNGKTTVSVSALYKIMEKMAAKEYKNNFQCKYNIWNHTSLYTPCYMINVSEALQDIRLSFGDSKALEENNIYNKVKISRVVLFDDIFAERLTSWACEVLHNWLNYRYNNNKPTLFTSNLSFMSIMDMENLGDFITENDEIKKRNATVQLARILDRMYECCEGNIIEFAGNSIRTKNMNGR